MGRLSEEEQSVVDAIEQIRIHKDIPLSEIPICESLDDLLEAKLLIEAFEPDSKQEVNNSEEKLNAEIDLPDEVDNDEGVSETVETPELTEGNNLREVGDFETTENLREVQELDIAANSEVEDFTEILEELNDEGTQQEVPEFIAADYDPFSDDIIERSYNANGGKTEFESDHLESEEEELEESHSTPVDDLNPRTKKRAAEQTADAILKGYAKIAPMPFKWLAKVDEQKVERLAMEGQIDINIEVEPGMTFDEYMKQTNEQVEEVFEVEEETLEEIREPLVEVLMEQQMELTPQQRLMMAVVSHLFQMLTVALKLRKQNNRILEYQKQMTFQSTAKRA